MNVATKCFFSQEIIATGEQQERDTLMPGSVKNYASAEDIQVLSSELIVIEDSVEDDVPTGEQKLPQSKFLKTVDTVANLGIKPLFQRKADKTS